MHVVEKVTTYDHVSRNRFVTRYAYHHGYFDGFERDNVHGLLALDQHPNDKTPGDYPIAWAKLYGKGRVFYTSLGHREDVWTPDTPAGFKRENPKEVSEAYQKHILGGIKWALGLEPGDAKPQARTESAAGVQAGK